MIRPILRAIQFGSNLCTLAACQLVKWTGKSKAAIHPKHFLHDKRMPRYMDYVKPGTLVGDLGAGVCTHSVRCARAGATVVAVDRTPRNLAMARKVAAGARVRLIRHDIEQPLPFRSEVFDGVLLLDVLEHINNADGALREAVRTLKIGGWFALSLPNADTTWKRRYRKYGLFWMSDRDHKKEYLWPEIEAMLRAVNLEVVSGPHAIIYDTPLTGLIDLAGGFSIRLYTALQQARFSWVAKHPEETAGFVCIAVRKA